LKLITSKTEKDFAYNREFQRMRYLTESPVGDDESSKTSTQLLKDLGVNVPQTGANWNINKRAPHPKYY
jgi:hypothetical protein